VLRGSETDKIPYEVFEANEERELTATDPNKQNLSACMALADFNFNNNGTFEELFQQLDAVINKL
jgi:dephospho-CoA kinase